MGNVRPGDVQMSDRAEPDDAAAEADTGSARFRVKIIRFASGRRIDLEEYDVGLRVRIFDMDSRDGRQALCQGRGVRVIVLEAIYMMLQRMNSRRREHAALPQGAAEAVLETPGSVDELL